MARNFSAGQEGFLANSKNCGTDREPSPPSYFWVDLLRVMVFIEGFPKFDSEFRARLPTRWPSVECLSTRSAEERVNRIYHETHVPVFAVLQECGGALSQENPSMRVFSPGTEFWTEKLRRVVNICPMKTQHTTLITRLRGQAPFHDNGGRATGFMAIV